MLYSSHYDSPLGGITLASDGEALTGLWFDGQKYFAGTMTLEGAATTSSAQSQVDVDSPLFDSVRQWLDIYFCGRNPGFTPQIRMTGSPFRQRVWQSLLRIPYGQTTTYSAIAREIAAERGLKAMSAQAVGGAVGHNPISLIIPCHRVVGSDGSLTGYAGGIDRKLALLRLEGAEVVEH